MNDNLRFDEDEWIAEKVREANKSILKDPEKTGYLIDTKTGEFKPFPEIEKMRSIDFLVQQLNKLSKGVWYCTDLWPSGRYELTAINKDIVVCDCCINGRIIRNPVINRKFYTSYSRLYKTLDKMISDQIRIRAINKHFAERSGRTYIGDF